MELEEYISRFSAGLTRLCMSLCGNRYDAEDLFQETWTKAIRHFSKFDRDTDFEKWLYKICVNTYKNSVKSIWHKKRYSFRTPEEADLFFNAIPEINESNRDEYLSLYEAISTLPKKQRVVIVLFYFKDYSIKEISQIADIPEGTVKSRLSQAKLKLKRGLKNG